ncbi:MAG: alpha/beta hydrolase [Acidobacteriota bacterium]|jgi:pimeloyl-ACP methyl ester carboxylesterase
MLPVGIFDAAIEACRTGFTGTLRIGMELYCERIGGEGPALLLLHGLAANGAVWTPVAREIRERWPGRILIPDLRGHGRSPHAFHYGYGQHAADVAGLLEPGEPVTVVGHSMGAVVGLALACGWFGVSVAAVFGFSIKVNWTEAEIEKAHSLSAVPGRWFETRSAAVERFLRRSGLSGLVDDQAEVVAAGVRQEAGRWRLAADPRIFSAPGPSFQEIFRLAQIRSALACGSEDPMVSIEELRVFDPNAILLPGLGHNPHVEAPAVLVDAVDRFLAARPPGSSQQH